MMTCQVCSKIIARLGAQGTDGLRTLADLKDLRWSSARSLVFTSGSIGPVPLRAHALPLSPSLSRVCGRTLLSLSPLALSLSSLASGPNGSATQHAATSCNKPQQARLAAASTPSLSLSTLSLNPPSRPTTNARTRISLFLCLSTLTCILLCNLNPKPQTPHTTPHLSTRLTR